MDILLAHGYVLNDDRHERHVMKPYPPLGLLYLSSHLKQKGFDVAVFDATFTDRESFARLLDEKRPGIVGFSVNMMTKLHVLPMIRAAKERHCLVIVGGPDPPYYAEEYIEFGADIVVIGEGEQTLEELLPILSARRFERLSTVSGIAFKDADGTVRRTPARALLQDLDMLPYPDRAAVDMSRYIDVWRAQHGGSSISLITARGCPYSCTWCSHSVYGKTLRKRSPARVADEVELLRDTYQPDMLWYADDVFNINHAWLFQYASELKRRNITLPFECICRADRMNEEVVAALRAMGCFRLWIGSESGSQRLLDTMKRGVTAGQVQAMTRLAKSYGIETGMFLMWGFEDESVEDIAMTIEHVKKANPDLVLTTVSYPIKGTEYFDRMAEQGRIVTSRPWHESNDRDYRIRRRRSPRYYSFVNRWLYGELELTRSHNNGSWMKRMKAGLNARLGKWGMTFTSRQPEAQ